MLPATDVPPPQCLQANAQGQMPTCIQQSNGTWTPTFPDSGHGLAGALPVLVVVVVALGIAIAVWRISIARRIATSAGLDADQATAVTLLSKDGLEATYLAASLRPAQPSRDVASSTSIAERLRGLNDLKEQGLITADEYAQRRTAIINEA